MEQKSLMKLWLEETGLLGNEAAEKFGVTRQTISRAKKMPDWDDTLVRLAMSAVAAGLEPWSPETRIPQSLKLAVALQDTIREVVSDG